QSLLQFLVAMERATLMRRGFCAFLQCYCGVVATSCGHSDTPKSASEPIAHQQRAVERQNGPLDAATLRPPEAGVASDYLHRALESGDAAMTSIEALEGTLDEYTFSPPDGGIGGDLPGKLRDGGGELPLKTPPLQPEVGRQGVASRSSRRRFAPPAIPASP